MYVSAGVNRRFAQPITKLMDSSTNQFFRSPTVSLSPSRFFSIIKLLLNVITYGECSSLLAV